MVTCRRSRVRVSSVFFTLRFEIEEISKSNDLIGREWVFFGGGVTPRSLYQVMCVWNVRKLKCCSCGVTSFLPSGFWWSRYHTGFAKFEEPYFNRAWVQSWAWKQGSWRDVLDPKFIGPGPHNCKPAPFEALECALPLPTTSARVSE